MEIAAAVDRQRIAVGELLQILRQFARCRHGRAVDQNGNDREAVGERGRDLHPDGIVGVVDPVGCAVASATPFRTDDRDQHAVPAQRLLDRVAEIGAGGDAAGVEEDLVLAETVAQMIADTPGDILRIGAAI